MIFMRCISWLQMKIWSKVNHSRLLNVTISQADPITRKWTIFCLSFQEDSLFALRWLSRKLISCGGALRVYYRWFSHDSCLQPAYSIQKCKFDLHKRPTSTTSLAFVALYWMDWKKLWKSNNIVRAFFPLYTEIFNAFHTVIRTNLRPRLILSFSLAFPLQRITVLPSRQWLWPVLGGVKIWKSLPRNTTISASRQDASIQVSVDQFQR